MACVRDKADLRYRVVLRAVQPDDVPAVCGLLHETWHHTYATMIPRWNIDQFLTGFASWEQVLSTPGLYPGMLMCAELDGVLVGVVQAEPTDKRGTSAIWILYVRPAYQGLGIGSALLRAVYCRFNDATSYRLEVLMQNRKAIAFYKSRGFKVSSVSITKLGLVPTFFMTRSHSEPFMIWKPALAKAA